MKLLEASIGAVAIAGAVFGVTSISMVDGWSGQSTDNAYVRGDVVPVSPKITGYIAEVAVADNEPVKAGQVLYRIEDNEYRARVASAKAALASKRAAIANLESRLSVQRANIEHAEANLQGARAEADRAARDFVRIENLTKSGTVSQASLETARSTDINAAARVSEAVANLAAAKAEIDVLESQRPQLQADADGAAAALQLAQIELDNTLIRAPADGTVGERQAKSGQFVRPGTALIPFVGEDKWIIANFKETQLPGVRFGGTVEIRVDALPDVTLQGKIESISPASGAQFALLPPDNATGNFTKIVQRVPVKVTLNEGQSGLGDLRPGMSAVITIR
ncbi:HlyD family secretion protein [Ensifer sesbaniae]|jgi:membrane fusion protein (multidrug efflux system)|uniref:HlyD family secretion protein n=1 Tax=Ensifer sesbaniae TaxID=1214071 RepID=UPI0015693521|nr:HlyD family secretion protein [Ensifer sesbaniae]NRQ16686.1 putative multidrug resistance protein EmrK [Ensifer sesbaniae]